MVKFYHRRLDFYLKMCYTNNNISHDSKDKKMITQEIEVKLKPIDNLIKLANRQVDIKSSHILIYQSTLNTYLQELDKEYNNMINYLKDKVDILMKNEEENVKIIEDLKQKNEELNKHVKKNNGDSK